MQSNSISKCHTPKSLNLIQSRIEPVEESKEDNEDNEENEDLEDQDFNLSAMRLEKREES